MPENYPRELKILGDRIRKRRLELGLFQRQVAEAIGVDADTIWRWERNATGPPVRYIPRIIRFLGYNPFPIPRALPERLLAARKALGLTQEALAKRLAVDPVSLCMWERGKRRLSKRLLRIVEIFLRTHHLEFN